MTLICKNCGNTGIAWYGGQCPCRRSHNTIPDKITSEMLASPNVLTLEMIQRARDILLGIEPEPKYISVSHWGLFPA